MKPLLLATAGRAITNAPLGRREDDVEVRRVPALPLAGALDPERPTVVLLDRVLLSSTAGDHARLAELAGVAAIVGIGDPGEAAPPADFPLDLLTSWIA